MQQTSLQDARFVRIWIQPYNGLVRCHAVHYNYWEEVIDDGITIPQALFVLPIIVDSIPEESIVDHRVDLILKPDISTLSPIPYIPQINGKREYRVFGNYFRFDGQPDNYCPRQFLKGISNQLLQEFNFVAKVGIEIEFYLLEDREDIIVQIDSTCYGADQSLNQIHNFMAQLADNLEAQGIRIEQFLAECGGGQFELVYSYDEINLTADRNIIVKQTIQAVAKQNAYRATFSPYLGDGINFAGTGAHTHFSLNSPEGNNLMEDKTRESQLSIEAEHFLAGILNNYQGLMALTCAQPLSYKRIQPGVFVGAYNAWGHQNRECAVRVCTSARGHVTNFEIRAVDHTANIYLALAGILISGMQGLRENLTLPPECKELPFKMSEEQQNQQGIKLLPQSLEESLLELESNELFKQYMGVQMHRVYCDNKKEEIKLQKELCEDEAAVIKLIASKF